MSSILPISHLIDDALSSPVSESPPWSTSPDAFFSSYSQPEASSYSPQPSESYVQPLKSRYSPDSSSEGEHLCMPTHQLFDLPVSHEGSVRSPSPFDDIPGGVKRQGGSRKPRERISTKDFIPPDVSGLSKREARLVKNRAAAFLSRQRKREEFETMEVRVAELEQENARLLAITRGEIDPVSEVEQLRAQLAAAEQRSNELSAQLALQDSTPSGVKMESFEQSLPESLPPSSRASPEPQPGHKSGASLGLMVLLCALPSLLSLPTQSAVPATFSLPLSQSSLNSWGSSAFDINSLISSEDRDWSSLDHGMDLDFDMNDAEKMSPFSLTSANGGKLELGNHGLDISFDAIPSEDGKIRVRIHPPSASSSPPSSSPPSSFVTPSFLLRSEQEDPFFGVGGVEFDHHSLDSDPEHRLMQSVYEFDQDTMGSAKKRVKIALKNMPSEGSEGGEWEVEIC